MNKIIKDENTILALVVKGDEWPEGLHFHTADEDFLQVATWGYSKGKKSSAHAHKIAERVSDRTNEAIFVRKGKIRGRIYSEQDKLVEEVTLGEGDMIVIFNGGHAFETLEDGTQVLEVKNGPYPGMEKDKRTLGHPYPVGTSDSDFDR